MNKYFKRITYFVLIFVLLLSLTGCGKEESTNDNSSSNTKTGTSSKTSSSELEANITSDSKLAKSGKIIVFATNKNSVAVDLEFEAEFYDAEGNLVGTGKEYLTGVGVNSEVAVEIYDTPSSYDNYKLYVDAEESTVKTYFDNIEISNNDNKEEILVQVTNNSSEEIEEISVAVVYYNGDELVGIADDLEFDVKSGRSANFTLYYPYDKNYDDLEFDTYKVYVNEAYTYEN